MKNYGAPLKRNNVVCDYCHSYIPYVKKDKKKQ